MKGFWMLVDAAVFAVACAVLISMPHATRPAQALESVALSTALEDIALAASSQPDLVESACASAAGEATLREKFEPATSAFSASSFSIRCPGGKTISISDGAAPSSGPAKSISTNRVIVPKSGLAMLVFFEAQSYGG